MLPHSSEVYRFRGETLMTLRILLTMWRASRNLRQVRHGHGRHANDTGDVRHEHAMS